jgi:hypothetical protein
MLLKYFLNDFEMVPVAPIITGVTFVFTFHYYYYYDHHHNPRSLPHSSLTGSQKGTGISDQALLLHSSAKNFLTIWHYCFLR